MGFFTKKRTVPSLLIEAFYKIAGDMGYIERLLCLEAGADTSEILRETDFYVDGADGVYDFKEADRFYFGAFVYLPGRFVWFNQWVFGDHLAKLFSFEEQKALDEDTALDALLGKWSDICSDPDKYISSSYNPSFIYYDQVEMVRLSLDKELRPEMMVRSLSGFTYTAGVRARQIITGTRSQFVDRDDIRFLNARIAERNLRN